MTRKKIVLVVLMVIFILVSFLWEREEYASIPEKHDVPILRVEPVQDKAASVDQTRPRGMKRLPASQAPRPVNTPTSAWKEKLKDNLRSQGGDKFKDIDLVTTHSLVWKESGIPLAAKSVIVTLKNEQNVETSFRVLVDAETGKILKNWDQPIIDSANPRDNFKVRIDPRYHQE